MFTNNLKQLRLSYNLTQKQLAEELDISQQAYMKWETGKTSPTLTSLEKIANFFDIPMSILVSNNVIQLEDILNADNIDFNGIPLKSHEVQEFQELVFAYIDSKLSDYTNAQATHAIRLKNGEWIQRSTK